MKQLSGLLQVFAVLLALLSIVTPARADSSLSETGHRILIQAVSADSGQCTDEVIFTVYLKNAGKHREENIGILIESPELGAYYEVAGLFALPGMTIVRNVAVKIPENNKSGNYAFRISASRNSIVTDRVTEPAYVEVCEKHAVPVLPDAELDNALPAELKHANKWFWPVFAALTALIVAELAGFWMLDRKKRKTCSKADWEREIEDRAARFTEEDRLY